MDENDDEGVEKDDNHPDVQEPGPVDQWVKLIKKTTIIQMSRNLDQSINA